MKDTPLLMAGPMVRATLSDLKDQTRRLVLPQPDSKGGVNGCLTVDDKEFLDTCPYGRIGDRLWVRECFYIDTISFALGEKLPKTKPSEVSDDIYYRADGDCCSQIPECACGEIGKPKWRPSIFMPKWACRIYLEILEVRVERLNDITENDVKREGGTWRKVVPRDTRLGCSSVVWSIGQFESYSARSVFEFLWDALNAKRGYDSDSNPWVWVITFKRIE